MQMLLLFTCMLTAGFMPASYAEDALNDESCNIKSMHADTCNDDSSTCSEEVSTVKADALLQVKKSRSVTRVDRRPREGFTAALGSSPSNADYATMFQATGCPNALVLEWWKEATHDVVCQDMYAYCEETRTGRATSHDKMLCCGKGVDCTPTACIKQCGTRDYVALFQATGCPSPVALEWWKEASDEVACNDMYHYCEVTQSGKATQQQKDFCCGQGSDCRPAVCTKQCGPEEPKPSPAESKDYVAMFQATGCPNSLSLEWWKEATDDVVCQDMYAYCEETRTGRATSHDKMLCCGKGVDCTPAVCSKQCGTPVRSTTGGASWGRRMFAVIDHPAMFQATGCPNPLALEWWKDASDEVVCKDMFAYCEETKTGRATSHAKNLCCGTGVDCTPTACIKQCGSIDDYVGLFQATGCPASVALAWWKSASDDVVCQDMYAYCEVAKSGQASQYQKDICCGKGVDCKPAACTKRC